MGHAKFIGHEPPHLDAASCRWGRGGPHAFLDLWSVELVLGQPLPTLPLWLAPELVLPLDLEESYEQACRDLWIA